MEFVWDIMSISKGAELAWKHAQTSGWHRLPANIMKNTLEIFREKNRESTLGLWCVTSHQQAYWEARAVVKKSARNLQRYQPSKNVSLSPYISFWRIEPRGTSWLEWAEERQFLLQGHALVDIWKLDDSITKPCVLIHAWAGPHHAGVVPLSWFWPHCKVQGKGEAGSPATWNPVYNTGKVT